MNIFFATLQDIESWISSLQSLNKPCPKCDQYNTLHSHGFVRKQVSSTESLSIGKRVYCCNRRDKKGCGATFQLYISDFTQWVHFSIIMITAIIGPENNRQKRTKEKTPSQRTKARWQARIKTKLHEFKTFIVQHSSGLPQQSTLENASFLMQTVQQLLHISNNIFQTYQQENQKGVFQ